MNVKVRGVLMFVTCAVLTIVLSLFTDLGLWVLLVPLVYGLLFLAILVEGRKRTKS